MRPHRGPARRRLPRNPGTEPRGLSWSDFAVLYRSVAKDAGPARRGVAAPRHPVRRQGPQPPVRQPRDPGCRRALPLHGRRDRRVRAARAVGGRPALAGQDADWPQPCRCSTKAATSDRGARWGVYNIQRLYLDVLEALDLREDTVPGDAVAARLVFYQLGKFSQVISDFEEIYFALDARGRSTRRSLAGSRTRRPTTTRSPTPTSGTRTPDAVVLIDGAPGQGHAVAGRVRAVPAQEPVPVPSVTGGLNLFHVIPRRRSQTPTATAEPSRTRPASSTSRSPGRRSTSSSPTRPVPNELYRSGRSFFDHCTQPAWVRRPATTGVPEDAPRLRPDAPSGDAAGHAVVLRAQVPLRVPLPVQAALPLWVQPAHPRGARATARACTTPSPRCTSAPSRATSSTLDAADACRPTPAHPVRLPGAARDSYASPRSRPSSAISSRTVTTCPNTCTARSRSRSTSPRDHRRRPHRPDPPARDRRAADRRLQVDRARSGRRRHPRPAACLRVGYEELTGERRRPDRGAQPRRGGRSTREEVDAPLLTAVRDRIRDAGDALRTNDLPRHASWCTHCDTCDVAALCRSRP